MGCYLSHLNLYKAFLSNGNAKPYLMVFEDDVKFDKDIGKKINQVLVDLPPWDILLLACVCLKCTATAEKQPYSDVQRFFLTHAMLMKRSGVEKLVSLLDTRPIEKQIDAAISDLAEQGRLKVICLTNNLADQHIAMFGTTIQIPVRQMEGVDPYDQT